MSPELAVLHAEGDRVRVSTVRLEDVAPYRRALGQSRERLARWNPVDPDDLERQLPRQSRDHRTFLVHARTPEGDHDIVGKINVSDVMRGRFESAAMGYDAYDPYAGRGLFAEGLRLVVTLAFTPETAGGMGLRRCGLDPATVAEVLCEAGQVPVGGRPMGLGLGPVVSVDTSREVGRSEIVRIALHVGQGPVPAPET